MIGVDIVDLGDPHSRKRNEEDLRFILTSEDLLPTIDDNNLQYWVIWAAKEAVFKAHRELTNFDPKKFHIQFDPKIEDQFSSGEFRGRLTINPNYIFAICAKNLSQAHFEIFESKATDQSSEVRAKFLALFSSQDKITIGVDEDALPIMIQNDQQSQISFSHHGRYLACGYLQLKP
jgi:phosphopantetheinyl transferase